MRVPDPNSQKGEFILYNGPMNSGKTETLVKHSKNLKDHASQNVQAFSILENTRDGLNQIVGDNGDRLDAISIPMNNPEFILDHVYKLDKIRRVDVVSIDEIGFFIYNIIPVIRTLKKEDRVILAATINKSFRGEDFGVVPYLLGLADPRSLESTTFNSYCKLIVNNRQCSNPATYTVRLSRDSDFKVDFFDKQNNVIEGYGFAPYFDPLKVFEEKKQSGFKQREYTTACKSCFKIPFMQETFDVYNSLIRGINVRDIDFEYVSDVVNMLFDENKIKSLGKGYYSAREHVFDINSGVFIPKGL